GPLSRHAVSGKLKEFEASFRQAQAAGEYPGVDELIRRLDALATPSIALAQPDPMPESPSEPVEAPSVETGPAI
ncbi:MAG: hypothetical protein LC745_01515, partial [Planctomycetia bacterium]|nr:hypothetical protein [Planctomycetia bacterium]